MYRERIEKLAPGYDPAHVEAWMRNEHRVLDALSREKFASEVKIACATIDEAGLIMSDRMAELEGLRPKKRAS